MTRSRSKKQLVLELAGPERREPLGERQIRALQAELRRRLGPEDKTSLSYIANILRAAGARVEYQDRFVDPLMAEPYASRLDGALAFRDFASAEASLAKLDALYHDYLQAADRTGTGLVRALVLKGKQRAESLAAGARVRPEKRREKKEIANWFRVWLEVPDLFFDWLAMRKQSQEFQRLFSNHHGQSPNRRDSEND